MKGILIAATVAAILFSVSRASPVKRTCDEPGINGLFLARKKTSFMDGIGQCAQMNGSLAMIDNQNYGAATSLVLQCIGQYETAWIGAWDYNAANPEERPCLALTVGFIAPGGGINADCNGLDRVALCQNTGNGRRHVPFANTHTTADTHTNRKLKTVTVTRQDEQTTQVTQGQTTVMPRLRSHLLF